MTVEEVNKMEYTKQYKKARDVVRLTEYIEDLKHFHTIYSAGDTDGDMAEELLMYEQVIDWLEELKHRRESEYPYYIADFVAVNKDGEEMNHV